MRARFALVSAVCAGTLLGAAIPALPAGVVVPATRLGVVTDLVGPNDLEPTDCAGIDLQQLVVGSGTVQGSRANDLVLASPASNRVLGRGGDDCLLGGGGDDVLHGGAGTDVCLGGPGTDRFQACEMTVD